MNSLKVKQEIVLKKLKSLNDPSYGQYLNSFLVPEANSGHSL